MSKQIIDLPKLVDSKDYVAANEKLTDLRLQLVEAERKREAILADINTPRPHKDPVHEAAQKMLDGDSTPLPSAAMTQLRESYQELNTRIVVIRTAIRMQEDTVNKLLSAASFKAVESVKPLHRDLVRGIVDQLKKLDEALTAEHTLRENLFLDGFNTGDIRHMGLNSLGLLSNEYSRASAYLLEACREGFISADQLPENLQKMVPPAPGAKPRLMKAAKAKFDDWTVTA